MPKQPLHIYKTPTADRKIKEIIKFSVQKWGKSTAKNYALDLEKTIRSIASGKLKTKINKEFSTRFSYYRVNKHYIFFEIQNDKLIVVTLFHVAMDIQNRLTDETTSSK
jgi:plasmid stabilization system protein ParE